MEGSANAAIPAAQRAQSSIANGNLTPSAPNGAVRPTSASPAAAGPNGRPLQRRPRPKKETNPLVANRRPPPRPKKPPTAPGSAPSTSAANSQRTNASPSRPKVAPQIEPDEAPEPKGAFKEYPVTTTKRAFMDGLRYHVMRMHSKKTVDIYEEGEFTKPVRLHRRDPRHIQEEEEDVKASVEDDKERERQEILKEERRRVREANAAMTAPSVKPNKPAPFQKKTEQVFRNEDTPEAKKKAQLRYEEALPWHLEDFDNKNVWVGTYEAELSEHHVGFIVDRDTGAFKMIPFEKWYKFVPKSKGKIWTAEQAEERYSKKLRPPLWVQENEKVVSVQREKARNRASNRLFTSTGGAARQGGGAGPVVRREAGGDMEDIDYNFEEDFADDEEGNMGLFEGEDEDTKIAEQKIKREQLGANVFGMTDAQKVWNEEDEEKKAEEEEKKLAKATRKTLIKREKNFVYDDDEKENPYTSQSDYEDSETERQKDEEQRRADEERAAAEKAKGKEAGQPPSESSTKGTNTPVERSKTLDSKASSSSMKRPGSPNLSEASGNESSRKKHKKSHASGTGSANPSRPMSPAPEGASRKGSFTFDGRAYDVVRRGAGSGSETEATDGGKKRKIERRLGGGSAAVSPDGSRAASPAAAGNSRAASPAANANPPRVQGQNTGFPTFEEIQRFVPPEGTLLENLLQQFRGRWRGEQRGQFMALVKSAARYDKDTKMLFRKS